MKPVLIVACIFFFIHRAFALIPPKFQWKTIDYAWEGDSRAKAIAMGAYIPQNVMPTGLARWKDKLFITVPRWKKGVPSSLNYVYLNGSQSEPLNPYPTWQDAFVAPDASLPSSNATVVSTFRVHVDRCDRLWVVDNGVADMATPHSYPSRQDAFVAHDASRPSSNATFVSTFRVHVDRCDRLWVVDNGVADMAMRQITQPALLIFDLNTDTLLRRYELGDDVLRDSSVLSSIVVDIPGNKRCDDVFAYITDMGSNAVIVYSMKTSEAWRVENHYFHFDPHAGVYKVGGIDFYLSHGVSSAALSQTRSDGHRDLYLHPTSSTKQFKMSTKLLRRKDVPEEDIFNGVEVIGDRGPFSQVSACDFDHKHNILFYTQICKNAIGCWNTDKPYTQENTIVLMKDCNLLEFPNDVKVDHEGNLWILSDKQSRFLYESMNFSEVNFRVLTAPVSTLVHGTACERDSALSRAFSGLSFRRNSKATPAGLKPPVSGTSRSSACSHKECGNKEK